MRLILQMSVPMLTGIGNARGILSRYRSYRCCEVDLSHTDVIHQCRYSSIGNHIWRGNCLEIEFIWDFIFFFFSLSSDKKNLRSLDATGVSCIYVLYLPRAYLARLASSPSLSFEVLVVCASIIGTGYVCILLLYF